MAFKPRGLYLQKVADDYASRLLRPIAILTIVGDDGLAVVEAEYPDGSLGPGILDPCHKLATPGRVVEHRVISGIVMSRLKD